MAPGAISGEYRAGRFAGLKILSTRRFGNEHQHNSGDDSPKVAGHEQRLLLALW
jgi:hypothetical protein